MLRVLKLQRIDIVRLASRPPGDIEIAVGLVWSHGSGYGQIV